MKQTQPVIKFHLPYPFTLSGRRKLKEQVKHLFTREKKSLHSLDYVFCSEDYLLGMNQQYLKHDTHTDIITFDLSDDPDKIVGEIYISVPRVKENALKFNTGFHEELRRVMLHGALHLCGYKDKTSSEAVLMKKKEDKYLAF